jgi:hypothetical protein
MARRAIMIAAILLASIDVASAQTNHTPAYPTSQHTPAYPTDQHTPAYPKSTTNPANTVTVPAAPKPAPAYYLTLIFARPNSFPRTVVVKSPQCTVQKTSGEKAFRCVQSTPLKLRAFASLAECEAAGRSFTVAAADPQHIIRTFRCGSR